MLSLYASEGAVTSVDGNDDSRYEGRNVAEEIEHGSHEILRLTELVGRSVGYDLASARLKFAGLLVSEEETVLVRKEESGSDGVATDAHGSHVHRVPLREIVDRALCRRVSGNLRQWTECVHRGDVQDIALAGFDHIPGEDHRGEKRTLEVKVIDELEAFDVEPVESILELGVRLHLLRGTGRLRRITAGAVDQDVDLAEFLVDEVAGCFESSLVKGAGADAEALDPELLGDGLAPGGVVGAAADDGQVHPGLREAARQGHAQRSSERAGENC